MMADNDNDSEYRNLWRAVGGLEANVERLVQGQERQERQQERLEGRLERLEQRFDWMLWGAIALGGTIIGLLIVEIMRSG